MFSSSVCNDYGEGVIVSDTEGVGVVLQVKGLFICLNLQMRFCGRACITVHLLCVWVYVSVCVCVFMGVCALLCVYRVFGC